MRRFAVILAFLVSSTALAAVPARPPSVVVVPTTPGATAAAQGSAKAFEDKGVRVLKPPTRRPSLAPEALARAVDADATVQIGLRRDRQGKRSARMRVVAPDGQVKFDGAVPIAGVRPTPDESSALASLALQSLGPPELGAKPPIPKTPIRPQPPPGPPNVAGHSPPETPPPQTPPFTAPVPRTGARVPTETPNEALPTPSKLGLADIWAGATLSWRSQGLVTTQPLPSLDFSTQSPYPGLTIGGDWFPFGGALQNRLGFAASYGYSWLHLNTLGAPNARASEQQFQGDVLWRIPTAEWGEFGVRAGVAYEGFIVPKQFPVVTSTHLSPRLGIEWGRTLFGPVGIYASGGVRPLVYVGPDLRAAYGQNASSTGIDAAVGLTGNLPLAGLRWSAGYGFLHYEDRLTGGGNVTRQTESLNRIGIGLTYERRL